MRPTQIALPRETAVTAKRQRTTMVRRVKLNGLAKPGTRIASQIPENLVKRSSHICLAVRSDACMVA